MSAAQVYRTVDVPVRGGNLRVGVWEPTAGQPDGTDNADSPTIVAIHGVTATHRCWDMVAQRLPGFRIVAPDLRGRGRSNSLPGPSSMTQHADDVADALDFLAIPRALVLGHSMGGHVSVVFAHRHSGRTAALVLVDGGVPLPVPEGITTEALVAALGPAADRLTMTFPDQEAYRQFWRVHPAFADDWNQAITDYVDYDLVGVPPELRSSTSVVAMTEDTVDMYSGQAVPEALGHLPSPTIFLRAPRGLLNDEPGLWPPEWIQQWQDRLPALDVREVADVNHYTILMSDRGAAAVSGAVLETLQRGPR
jgi:lipase